MTRDGVYDEAELYCIAFSWPVDEEVDWLLALAPGATSVLEPCCGQARFAEAFVERGIAYYGVDRCRPMLDRAPSGPKITLLESDVTSFDLGRRVDLAWCPINSLCHLAREDDVIAHLECVHRHLEPDAAYVIEVELLHHDGIWREGPADRSSWTVPSGDGTHVEATVWRESCDLAARTCVEHARYRQMRGGEVLRESSERFVMRMWTYEDLLAITRRTGFTVEHVFTNHGRRGRPEVPMAPTLENDGDNHYYVLRRRS